MSGTFLATGCVGAISRRMAFITTDAVTTLPSSTQFTRHFQRFQPGIARHQQQFDEGPVALGLFEDPVAHQLDGLG